MTDQEQREGARQFYNKWHGKGKEDEDDRSYWIDLMQKILGIESPTDYLDFQKKVIVDGKTKKIDVYVPETKVLIEQKSLNIPLDKKSHQSDGLELTPYEQAKRYNNNLPYSERARWIITSNFAELWIYDLEAKVPEPLKLDIEKLLSQYSKLDFLIKKEVEQISQEMQVSIQAGELVGKLYDAFLKQYKNPENIETLKSLNKLCVRIVFCLYAEDAGIFGHKNMFHDYLVRFDAKGARKALIELFKVLDQMPEERETYLVDDDPLLAEFPYVNGGLFTDEDIEIPPFTEEILNLILKDASDNFDWSQISPTIFGAVFESTLNPETRRNGGMHYTSIENIHKVIDPLFLNNIRSEFEEIRNISIVKTKVKKLKEFQEKLSQMRWLDPACGSGNFLTETYMSIRRIENEILRELYSGQITFGFESFTPIKVSIGQFYGIEINDFAVTVAKTALWIAESQMMRETEDIVHTNIEFLPLKTNASIIEGNALKCDWEEIVPMANINYIMGNPPFVGKKEQSKEQKEDVKSVFAGEKIKVGVLDYVTCWFYLASVYMNKYPKIKTAFVSTDSITQGEHVPTLWKLLYEKYDMKIMFGYTTFKWESESAKKAEVYCNIIGFSKQETDKYLYIGKDVRKVEQLNPYLLNAPTIWLETRKSQISGQNKMVYGSMPIDDGFLIVEQEEYERLKKTEPSILQYLKPYAGAEELLKGTIRYCLWLQGVSRKEILQSKFLSERVSKCKEFRENSKRTATNKLASTPELFGEIRQPDGKMIVCPKVSSKHRLYVPMLYVDSTDYIINGSALIIPNGTLYEFGILSSNVHNAWLSAIAETWGHSYQYSTDIYSNFPFPNNKDYVVQIENTAKEILEVRASHPDLTIAEMYNPKLGLIDDLNNAHKKNDIAVMKAYGLSIKDTSKASCVAYLMKLYKENVENINIQ